VAGLCAEREAAGQRRAQPKERAPAQQRIAWARELRCRRHVAPEFRPHVSSLAARSRIVRDCLSNIVIL
jgi:hypothetical protein